MLELKPKHVGVSLLLLVSDWSFTVFFKPISREQEVENNMSMPALLLRCFLKCQYNAVFAICPCGHYWYCIFEKFKHTIKQTEQQQSSKNKLEIAFKPFSEK